MFQRREIHNNFLCAEKADTITALKTNVKDAEGKLKDYERRVKVSDYYCIVCLYIATVVKWLADLASSD
jgi:hypothetical protein